MSMSASVGVLLARSSRSAVLLKLYFPLSSSFASAIFGSSECCRNASFVSQTSHKLINSLTALYFTKYSLTVQLHEVNFCFSRNRQLFDTEFFSQNSQFYKFDLPIFFIKFTPFGNQTITEFTSCNTKQQSL